MRLAHRVKRSLVAGLAGAMVFALLPAGVAAADVIDTDGLDACDGAEGLVDFNDALGFFESNIECMAAYGVTVGDADGNFNSPGSVTRQQMALFIARLATQALNGNTDIPATAADEFDDIANVNPPEARDAINLLAGLGIVEGVGGGDYDPSGTVTREQMASFIARAHVALEVDFADFAATPDVFGDEDEISDVHLDNVLLLADVGVVEGDAAGDYNPDNPVTRGQMSAFIVRSIAVLDGQGLWNGEFVAEVPVDSNQTFTVTPDDEVTLTAEDERQYTVSNPVADTEHTIALLPSENVSIDADGVVTFTDEDENDVADGLATTEAYITVVNGTSTGNMAGDDFEEVLPAGGEINFTVTSDVAESVVPVVFFDEDGGDDLDLNEDEVFGIGGQTNWIPAAGTIGDNYTGDVVQVNTADGFYTLDTGGTEGQADVLINYESGDDFVYNSGEFTDAAMSFDQFEAWLSVDDTITVTSYNPGGAEFGEAASEHDLTNDVPNAPSDLTGQLTGGDIELDWTAPSNPDVVNYDVQISTQDADGDFPDFGNLADTTDTEFTLEDAPAGVHQFRVVAENGNEDASPASNVVEVTVAEGADEDGPIIDSLVLLTDNDPSNGSDDGIMNEGDQVRFSFDEAVVVDGTATFEFSDGDGDVGEISCDGNATCQLSSNGETLLVTLTGDPLLTDFSGNAQVDYPAELTAASGVEDESGNALDLTDDGHDTTVEAA